MAELQEQLQALTDEFLRVHTRKEDLFWETKMGLSDDALTSQRKLSAAEIEAQQFIQNPDMLEHLKQLRSKFDAAQTDDRSALDGWIRLFSANAIADQKAQQLAAEI